MVKKQHRCFQNSLFEEFQNTTCYVCCKSIRDDKGVCVGKDLYRHQNCKPGSKKWEESGLEERRMKISLELPAVSLPYDNSKA